MCKQDNASQVVALPECVVAVYVRERQPFKSGVYHVSDFAFAEQLV